MVREREQVVGIVTKIDLIEFLAGRCERAGWRRLPGDRRGRAGRGEGLVAVDGAGPHPHGDPGREVPRRDPVEGPGVGGRRMGALRPALPGGEPRGGRRVQSLAGDGAAQGRLLRPLRQGDPHAQDARAGQSGVHQPAGVSSRVRWPGARWWPFVVLLLAGACRCSKPSTEGAGEEPVQPVYAGRVKTPDPRAGACARRSTGSPRSGGSRAAEVPRADSSSTSACGCCRSRWHLGTWSSMHERRRRASTTSRSVRMRVGWTVRCLPARGVSGPDRGQSRPGSALPFVPGVPRRASLPGARADAGRRL